jgi:hypothetical protein
MVFWLECRRNLLNFAKQFVHGVASKRFLLIQLVYMTISSALFTLLRIQVAAVDLFLLSRICTSCRIWCRCSSICQLQRDGQLWFMRVLLSILTSTRRWCTELPYFLLTCKSSWLPVSSPTRTWKWIPFAFLVLQLGLFLFLNTIRLLETCISMYSCFIYLPIPLANTRIILLNKTERLWVSRHMVSLR